MRECLWLVKNGVPFDVAFGMDDIKRTAFCIVMSEMEGSRFNWNTMQFEEPAQS